MTRPTLEHPSEAKPRVFRKPYGTTKVVPFQTKPVAERLLWLTTICAIGSGHSKRMASCKRIREEVSPDLEITEITDRVSKIGTRRDSRDKPGYSKYAPGGPALLFENVKGYPGHTVLMNQFGSERRMAMALGVERLDEIAERITGLMNVKAPEGGFLDKLKMLPQLAELGNVFPKTVRRRMLRARK